MSQGGYGIDQSRSFDVRWSHLRLDQVMEVNEMSDRMQVILASVALVVGYFSTSAMQP